MRKQKFQIGDEAMVVQTGKMYGTLCTVIGVSKSNLPSKQLIYEVLFKDGNNVTHTYISNQLSHKLEITKYTLKKSSKCIKPKNVSKKLHNVHISIEDAKMLYEAGGKFKEIALKTYTEEEIKTEKYPKTWDTCVNFLLINGIINDVNILNSFPSSEYNKAFTALQKLVWLRKSWVGTWEPEWKKDGSLFTYAITYKGDIDVSSTRYFKILTFPTKGIAVEFMNTFKGIIEEAKILI